MNPDMRLKEKVRHGTARHPISGMRFTLEPEKSHPQHFFVERHWHPQIEILYFIKGTFDVEINFETTVFHEGELCILNSEDLHQITGKEPHTAHEALVFDPDILTFSYMDELEEDCIQPLVNRIVLLPHRISRSQEIYSRLLPYIRELMDTAIQKEPGWYVRSKLSLLLLLSLLWESGLFQPAEEDRSSSYMRKVHHYKTVVSYMEQNFSKHISLQELADTIPCNSQYLCRFFKEVSGNTPIQYLTTLRIKNACFLLTHTSRTILEIALECGFENISYFIRTFKSAIGCTPGEYRRKDTHSGIFDLVVDKSLKID